MAAGEGEIRAIYVHPAHWGKGAAEILFRSALKNLYIAGYNSVYLWVLKENGRARRFYEKMGLQASGVLRTVQIEEGYRRNSVYRADFEKQVRK